MKLSNDGMLVLGLGMSLLLTVAACSRSAKTGRSAKSNDSIQLGVAVAKDIPIQIQGSGHVTPFATVSVKSRVDGELKRALFNEGDELKRGETILVIDSRVAESAVRQAEANLQRDQALAASAEAEAHQNEVLFNEGIGAAELVEQTRAAADASQATVAADKVAVENAQLQLSFCRIASPIRGRAGKLLTDVGNAVKSEETTLAVVNQTSGKVVILKGDGNGKPKSAIIQAADNLCRKLASFDGPARPIDELRSGEGGPPVRLLSNR